MPLKLTDVAPVKPDPASWIVSPHDPEGGSTLVTEGRSVNGDGETPVPFEVVTATNPSTFPAGTTAEIVWSFTMVKDTAGIPSKVTEVAPVKLAPVIVTLEPTRAGGTLRIPGGWGRVSVK